MPPTATRTADRRKTEESERARRGNYREFGQVEAGVNILARKRSRNAEAELHVSDV
jgi:hypothetical protein